MDLSVVIPVYNAEKYIMGFLEQLNEQKTDYTFEVIVVDDGSSDRTLSILGKAKRNFPWLIFLHQENLKQAEARNNGMKHAVGKYICFIDADDELDSSYLDKLIGLIKQDESQLAVCGIQKVWVDRNHNLEVENASIFSNSESKSKLEIVGDLLNRNLEADVGLWNKIFERSIIEKNALKFKNENFFEDTLFVLEYLLNIDNSRISVTDDVLYSLKKRRNSSTTTSFNTRMDVLTDNFFKLSVRIMLDEFGKNKLVDRILETLKVRLKIHQINYHLITDPNWNTSKTKEIVRLSGLNFFKIFYYNLTFKYRVSCILLSMVPVIYEKMYLKKNR